MTVPDDSRAVGVTVEVGVVGAEDDAESVVGVGASMGDEGAV
jgi:hypothetical protein